MVALGERNATGNGLPHDSEAAIQLWSMASERGNPEAARALALAFTGNRRNDGFEVDLPEGLAHSEQGLNLTQPDPDRLPRNTDDIQSMQKRNALHLEFAILRAACILQGAGEGLSVRGLALVMECGCGRWVRVKER